MRRFPPGTLAEGLGPRFIPELLIITLSSLSLILIWHAFIDWRRRKDIPKQEVSSSSFSARRLRIPGVLIVIVSLYLVFLKPIGFLFLTPIFIFLTMKTMGSRVKHAVVLGIFLTILVYIIFALGLRVPLPSGKIL